MNHDACYVITDLPSWKEYHKARFRCIVPLGMRLSLGEYQAIHSLYFRNGFVHASGTYDMFGHPLNDCRVDDIFDYINGGAFDTGVLP